MKRVLEDSVMAIFQIHVRIRTRSGSAIGPGWGSTGSFETELELPDNIRGTGGAALNAVQAGDLPVDVRDLVQGLIQDEFNGMWPGSVPRGKANVFVDNAAGDAVAVFYDPGLWEIIDWEIVGQLKELDEMSGDQLH